MVIEIVVSVTIVVLLVLILVLMKLLYDARWEADDFEWSTYAEMVLPWAQAAVSTALEVNRKSKDGLTGEEMKEIAIGIYDDLPSHLHTHKKTWLTRELFAHYVQYAYDLMAGLAETRLEGEQEGKG